MLAPRAHVEAGVECGRPAHGRVLTNALIVAHSVPSAAPCGRIVEAPTAAGTMNGSA